MSVRLHLSEQAQSAVDEYIPSLLSDFVASRITDQDATLWGSEAEAEASIRLGWVQSAVNSVSLVDEIVLLRSQLHAKGLNRIVLAGMGGSSLAPEVMCLTAGAELVVLDSTSPSQVRGVLDSGLARTVLVVSSKSGSTVETDSQRRIFEAAFIAEGIDPAERIVVVTDPGTQLEKIARKSGFRTFNADPHVGGRYSALSAFGLVPAGLAGVDIAEILNEAMAAELECAIDDQSNPALQLGIALAKSVAQSPKMALVADGTHVKGLPEWIEQLVAESTGKNGSGILPVVLDVVSPELSKNLPGVFVVRFVQDAHEHHLLNRDRHVGEILMSGSLGALFVVWEFATAIASRILHVNPFDQPDVESAKAATRALLDARPESAPALFVDKGIEVRQTFESAETPATVREAVTALLRTVSTDGYVAIHCYADRFGDEELHGLRDVIAARAHAPITFGWGPRFLHSTGQFHKGGTPNGSFIQVIVSDDNDVEIPGLPFTCAQLLTAQAGGDAKVLTEHGRPVLTLTLTRSEESVLALFEAFN